MRFSLAAMVRRLRNPRRKAIPLRDATPPAVLATDLFRGFYLPVVETWGASSERLIATYERTLAEMVTDTPANVAADLDGIAAEIDRLVLRLTPRLRDWALRVEQWARGKWRGAVLSATGVDLQTMIGPEDVAETLDALVERNVGLVRDVSAQTRGRIADSVFRGLTNRTPAREVAREIAEAVGMGRARATRIAGDQLSKLTSALADERRREAGIDVWKWRHSAKKHPRDWHKARDGKLYGDTAGMVGREVDGQTVLAPPEPNDLPGRPPFCGCRAQAVIVFD